MPPHRSIELLAPAKNLTCGIEAINHGADAVYIGASAFGARKEAGNSPEDIEILCRHAHLFHARVYVAFNTILKEDELIPAERLIQKLYRAGADALIIQDMGIMGLDIPPIPLHASTQTDNRTAQKVHFLEKAGFAQIVLARELSLEDIRQIAQQTTVPLEVFVHGALCVSYSGQCYLSAAMNGRSANRGECAQCCRLPWSLVDAKGESIVKNKHLLSLKDMNRSAYLEQLLDAGVSSLKIEGRLKDVAYVKNITAYYRRQLEEIFRRRPEYTPASAGRSVLTFEPDPGKSFNRGFTDYFMEQRSDSITSFDTPKSLGEYIGRVTEVQNSFFTVNGTATPGNGDGLAFFNPQKELEGFRVNKAEKGRIYPSRMPPLLRPGTELYRNYDHAFERLLQKPSAQRKISLRMEFSDNSVGFTLCLEDETGARCAIAFPVPSKEPAQTDQQENIRRQLLKLGTTPFVASQVTIRMSSDWFVPSSVLSEMKRLAVEKLLQSRKIRFNRGIRKKEPAEMERYPAEKLSYLGNVSNTYAEAFYRSCGVKQIDPAFESVPPPNVPLMFTKHCLRYSMGWCPRFHNTSSPYREPFFLSHRNQSFRLTFDCVNCHMLVYGPLVRKENPPILP